VTLANLVGSDNIYYGTSEIFGSSATISQVVEVEEPGGGNGRADDWLFYLLAFFNMIASN
jgi:hypothetical protein